MIFCLPLNSDLNISLQHFIELTDAYVGTAIEFIVQAEGTSSVH